MEVTAASTLTLIDPLEGGTQEALEVPGLGESLLRQILANSKDLWRTREHMEGMLICTP